ncbi:MAG TPA: hypothetical protein ENK31_10640, partial [Nannocystis exedens]|nr:hypothetical protein [Nannocystis exedens]
MSAVSEFSCGSCGSLVQVEAHLRTATCPYCASPAVIERPVEAGRPKPRFVLAFVLPHERALEEARRWVRRAWIAPESLRKAKVEAIRGIYVPAYLFSATANANYSASIGENYTETYTSNGKTHTRTRTEWRTLHGPYTAYVSDIIVTASHGIQNHELEAIEPFDLRALRRYTPRLLSGWIAEEASLQPEVCQELASREAMVEVKRRIAAHLPGDRQRNIEFNATLTDVQLELLLVPVWVLPVIYGQDKKTGKDKVVR